MEVWIGRDGERHGPYKEEDVRQWLRSGQISTDDLGWYEGLADWQPLSVLFPDERPSAPPAFGASSPYAAPPIMAQTASVADLEDYAGFWKRFLAYLIDGIVLWIPNLLIQKMMGSEAAQTAMTLSMQAAAGDPGKQIEAMQAYYTAMLPAMGVMTVVGVLYFALCESSALQATLGKLAIGIRVTDMEGNRIGFGRALGRYFGKLVSVLTFFIGFLMVAWTRHAQALHDIMAGTLVLNGRANSVRRGASPTRRGGSFDA